MGDGQNWKDKYVAHQRNNYWSRYIHDDLLLIFAPKDAKD